MEPIRYEPAQIEVITSLGDIILTSAIDLPDIDLTEGEIWFFPCVKDKNKKSASGFSVMSLTDKSR